MLVAAPAAAQRMRMRLEDAVERPYEELAVHTVHDMCARLLHDEALEAGLDPFVVPLARADRLAMLLERLDDLPLREHDLGASPAALMARVVARIDRLKEELVDAERFAAWAQEADRPREREFAQLYLAHERLLVEQGALDAGDLVLRALRLLRDRPHVRARVGARHRHVLVDDLQDLSPGGAARGRGARPRHRRRRGIGGQRLRVRRRGSGAAARDGAAPGTSPRSGAATPTRRSCASSGPSAAASGCCAPPTRSSSRSPPAPRGASRARTGGEVRFWRCANERAQAQGVATHVERLVRAGTPPEEIAVLVRSVRTEGRAIGLALEERALPYRLHGVDAFFGAPEVRDLLAWLRLLVDPSDAAAVVRALSRPPIELGAVDLARCVQIARRRRLDMVAALVAANESPQIPPESRERILRFLKLLRATAAGLDTTRPDLFVHRLVDRLGLRRQQLFTAQADVVERLVMLSRFAELAASYVRRAPQATPREFARYAAAVADAGLGEEDPGGARRDGRGPRAHDGGGRDARGRSRRAVRDGVDAPARRAPRRGRPGAAALAHDAEAEPLDAKAAHVADMRRLTHLAMTRARTSLTLSYAERSDRDVTQPPSPFAEEARLALGAEWEEVAEELFGPEETLHATFQALRDELLRDVQRTARGLSELRFDTDLDVTHAVARYLEIVKVAALLERPAGQSVADALPGHQPAPPRGGLAAAARGPRQLHARRRAHRRRARRSIARRGPVRALRAVPGGVPPAARRGPRALRRGHRDVPLLPAALQVRARPAHPAGADAAPALRHPHPPGPRALPPDRRAHRRRAARPPAGRLAPRRASATARRSASSA